MANNKTLVYREEVIEAIHKEWDDCPNFDGAGWRIANDTEEAIMQVVPLNLEIREFGRFIVREDAVKAIRDALEGHYIAKPGTWVAEDVEKILRGL